MLTKQFDDVLPTFSYARVSEAVMPNLRFVIAALSALFAGYLGGVISRPAPLVAAFSPLSVLGTAAPMIDLSACWLVD
jgi:hypothetical protein